MVRKPDYYAKSTRTFSFDFREFLKYGKGDRDAARENFHLLNKHLDITPKTSIFADLVPMLKRVLIHTNRVIIKHYSGGDADVLYDSTKQIRWAYYRGLADMLAKQYWQKKVGSLPIDELIYNSSGYRNLVKIHQRPVSLRHLAGETSLMHLNMARYTRGIFEQPIPELGCFELGFAFSYSAAKWLLDKYLVSEAVKDKIQYHVQQWDVTIDKNMDYLRHVVGTGGDIPNYRKYVLEGEQRRSEYFELMESGNESIRTLIDLEEDVLYSVTGMTELPDSSEAFVIALVNKGSPADHYDAFQLLRSRQFQHVKEPSYETLGFKWTSYEFMLKYEKGVPEVIFFTRGLKRGKFA